ncbi:MAG: MFS transporter [Bacteroidetes bacterium]|nr:MAG: MFS transporter [Bacteroidota bacterium]TAG92332.1 MAG: MFS transporter [Bacteroidota bacterium]
MEIEKNNPRILNAWASFDWANSAYNLAITVAIFPAYYDAVTKAAFGQKNNITIVNLLGIDWNTATLYSLVFTFSFLLTAILSPLLAGIADRGGKKKSLMRFFTYLGASGCIGLTFFTGENITWGLFCAFVANTGFSASLVFYVSYLPEIATSEKWDRISAKGFSAGFLGSVVHLIICLALILNAKNFQIDEGIASRFSFFLVGIWWLGFSQIAFYYLPEKKIEYKESTPKLLQAGFKELKKVYQNLQKLPQAKWFLLGFFFYSMGSQTIVLLATLFGSQVLKMGTSELIPVILMLQFLAIIGAYSFAILSEKIGNRNALLIKILFWGILAILGYFIATKTHFYMLSIGVGVIMGAMHLSRSTYAKLISSENQEENTSYFSFYDVTEKLAIMSGTFVYAMLTQVYSMQVAILALFFFFLLGFLCLLKVKN